MRRTMSVTERGHDYPVADTDTMDSVLTSSWKVNRCRRCGQERGAKGSKFECRGLTKVRGTLRRSMTPKDEQGFCFESVFGCDKSVAFHTPHILVRVELRTTKNEGFSEYKFYVFVDYHLPVGAGVEDADHLNQAVSKATRRAKWAHALTDGLEWTAEEVTGRGSS